MSWTRQAYRDRNKGFLPLPSFSRSTGKQRPNGCVENGGGLRSEYRFLGGQRLLLWKSGMGHGEKSPLLLQYIAPFVILVVGDPRQLAAKILVA